MLTLSSSDYSNKIIGELTVKKQIKDGHKLFWACECSCGNICYLKTFQITKAILRNSHISCGCKIEIKLNRKDCNHNITGERFGSLVVDKLSNNVTARKEKLWLCNCDCGNVFESTFYKLVSRYEPTCDSKNHEEYDILKYGDIPPQYLMCLKYNCYLRGREYKISPEYLSRLFIKQNRKCALSGLDLFFGNGKGFVIYRKLYCNASLDRIDSSFGYLKSNVQWVHKDIQKMKSDLKENYFLQYCKLCYLNKKE